MPHLLRDRDDNARDAGWFHLFWNLTFFAAETVRCGVISPRNRQFCLGIEEMQTASLRRQADLIAARDGGFGGYTGGGDAGSPDPRPQQGSGGVVVADLNGS